MSDDPYDIAVVGAGAAGLFAAIACSHLSDSLPSEGRVGEVLAKPRRSSLRVVALDSASKLGAKILVAGGGRCNVTHHHVDESAYAGSSPHAIKKILRQFTVEDTIAFFRDRAVELKREDTGKLFPTSDDARDVLNALLSAATDAGVRLTHPWRVAKVEKHHELFFVSQAGDAPPIVARRLILATGGKSLPKTGSDGLGLQIARSLGHTVTPGDSEGGVFPALVPLTLEKGHWLTSLSGITLDASLELRSGTGKKLRAIAGSVLLTHVGLSGPCVLDMSRFYTAARRQDTGATLTLSVLPRTTSEELRTKFEKHAQHSAARFITDHGIADRLSRALCAAAGFDPVATVRSLTREQRASLITHLTALPLPITGDRGWLFAEVTAGGVPLAELDLATMESRVCPGLHLCGEVLDVDGRIGGFNFQWAWSSGFVAGRGAAGLATADNLGR